MTTKLVLSAVRHDAVDCMCSCGNLVTLAGKLWWDGKVPTDCGHLLTDERDHDLIESKMLRAYRRLKNHPWLSFIDFYIAVEPPPTSKHRLVKRNPKKPLSAGNLHWIVGTQGHSLGVDYEGVDMTLKSACTKAGIGYSTAKARRASGLDWQG